MLPPELTNAIEEFIVYVHRNEAHFTYICVNHTNAFEADNIYRNPPPNVISTKKIILFRSWAPPMTLLTGGAPTDPQLLADGEETLHLALTYASSPDNAFSL